MKLVNGVVANTGLLLVYYQGSWGTVCDDLWDVINADVVCKQMGYPGAALDRLKESQLSSDYGSYPILLDGVNCTGRETNLSGCQFNEPMDHDCKHEEDVYLLCQLPQPSGKITYFHCIQSDVGYPATSGLALIQIIWELMIIHSRSGFILMLLCIFSLLLQL